VNLRAAFSASLNELLIAKGSGPLGVFSAPFSVLLQAARRVANVIIKSNFFINIVLLF
jgi:hypothetical protein